MTRKTAQSNTRCTFFENLSHSVQADVLASFKKGWESEHQTMTPISDEDAEFLIISTQSMFTTCGIYLGENDQAFLDMYARIRDRLDTSEMNHEK